MNSPELTMGWFLGNLAIAASNFLVLPIVGLYFSLRFKHLLPAFLATVAIGAVAPFAITFGIYLLFEESGLVSVRIAQKYRDYGYDLLAILFQFLLGAFFLRRQYLSLVDRRFALEGTG